MFRFCEENLITPEAAGETLNHQQCYPGDVRGSFIFGFQVTMPLPRSKREEKMQHRKQHNANDYDLRQRLERNRRIIDTADRRECEERQGARAIVEDLRRSDFWPSLLYQDPEYYQELLQEKLLNLDNALLLAERPRDEREIDGLREQMNLLETKLVQYENELRLSERRFSDSQKQISDLETQLSHEIIRSETAQNTVEFRKQAQLYLNSLLETGQTYYTKSPLLFVLSPKLFLLNRGKKQRLKSQNRFDFCLLLKFYSLCHESRQKLSEQESKFVELLASCEHWQKQTDLDAQKLNAEIRELRKNLQEMEEELKIRDRTIDQMQCALNESERLLQLQPTRSQFDVKMNELKPVLLQKLQPTCSQSVLLNQLQPNCSQLDVKINEWERVLLQTAGAAKKREDALEIENQNLKGILFFYPQTPLFYSSSDVFLFELKFFKGALEAANLQNQQLELQNQRLIEQAEQLNAISQANLEAFQTKSKACENLKAAFEDLRNVQQQQQLKNSAVKKFSEDEDEIQIQIPSAKIFLGEETDDKDVAIMIKTAQIEKLTRELEQLQSADSAAAGAFALLSTSKSFAPSSTAKSFDPLSTSKSFAPSSTLKSETTKSNDKEAEIMKYKRRWQNAEDNNRRLIKEGLRGWNLQEGECQKLRKIISELQNRLKASKIRDAVPENKAETVNALKQLVKMKRENIALKKELAGLKKMNSLLTD